MNRLKKINTAGHHKDIVRTNISIIATWIIYTPSTWVACILRGEIVINRMNKAENGDARARIKN